MPEAVSLRHSLIPEPFPFRYALASDSTSDWISARPMCESRIRAGVPSGAGISVLPRKHKSAILSKIAAGAPPLAMRKLLSSTRMRAEHTQ